MYACQEGSLSIVFPCSGDIGEWQPDGSMKIIDRKKNIFKLSQGEYIAVENLESIYLRCNLITSVSPISHHGARTYVACTLNGRLTGFHSLFRFGFMATVSNHFLWLLLFLSERHSKIGPLIITKLVTSKHSAEIQKPENIFWMSSIALLKNIRYVFWLLTFYKHLDSLLCFLINYKILYSFAGLRC